MNYYKYFSIGWLLFLILWGYIGFCQTKSYQLQTLQNKFDRVLVIENHVDNEFKVVYKNKGFCFPETYGIEGRAEIIDDIFLKISYRVRIGSGIRMRRTVFFCINNNKLIESLMIETQYDEDLTETFNKEADSLKLFDEHRHYKVDYNFKNNISLELNIHDENISKAYPKENYNYNSTISLRFNKNKGIFYNEEKKLNGIFSVVKNNTMLEGQCFKGKYPYIQIYKTELYYINGLWMEIGQNNTVLQYSFECNK